MNDPLQRFKAASAAYDALDAHDAELCIAVDGEEINLSGPVREFVAAAADLGGVSFDEALEHMLRIGHDKLVADGKVVPLPGPSRPRGPRPKPPEPRPDSALIATLAWLASETSRMLDSYAKQVETGNAFDAALEFSGYVQWSGVTTLCTRYAQTDAPKIDGAALAWKAQDLQRAARAGAALAKSKAKRGEQARQGSGESASALDSINHKLDLIAGLLGRGQ